MSGPKMDTVCGGMKKPLEPDPAEDFRERETSTSACPSGQADNKGTDHLVQQQKHTE